jgi:A/G-specific adenine glycosylase
MTNKKSHMHPDALSRLLLAWWDAHGRHDLPWQKNPVAYRVWVSEVMLQQTQVATVLKYFDRFMGKFPELSDLAAADIDEVLHLWTGLGYYSRARNLHKSARHIVEEHHGIFPDEFDLLMKLPGVGRSTAGAILSLANNQRYPILDGNAKRVLARVFGIKGWPGKSAVMKDLWEFAEICTPHQRVNNYTQAIMDLGASLCSRRNPQCDACPLKTGCMAFSTDSAHDFPGKKPKKIKPNKHIVLAMLINTKGALLLEKRPETGIWGGLYSFPEFDSLELAEAWCIKFITKSPKKKREWLPFKHSFSHYDLFMQPLELFVSGKSQKNLDEDRWLWYNIAEPVEIGLAAPVKKLIESFGEQK